MAIDNTQLGGGTFSGRAIYGTSVFEATREDVADMVSMISPAETILLSALGDPLRPAHNVYHEWLEEELGPNAIINSIAVASTTADIVLSVANAATLQKGMILRGPEVSGAEYFQILNVAAPTITVSRAFAGTTANSFGTGQYLTIVSDAAPDGADVLTDTSRPRIRFGNYTQIFKKDVIISGTMEAVDQLGGITDEEDHQKQIRLREALRDLEKAVILGRISGNTIGSPSTTRTMRGLLQAISTNSFNVASIGLDYGATTMAFFEDQVNIAIKAAWLTGGTDLDLVVCGDMVKKRFDQLNNSRVRVANDESTFRNQLVTFENTYGIYRILLNRWMPTHKAMFLSTARVKVVPLNGRSFHYEPTAKTGDAVKGMVLGEYTLEHKNQEGMSQTSFGTFAPGAGERSIQAP